MRGSDCSLDVDVDFASLASSCRSFCFWTTPSFSFGQELFEARPCSSSKRGGIFRFTGHTGQTAHETVQTAHETVQTARWTGLTGQIVAGPLFFALPPPSVDVFVVAREVLLCSTFLSGLSSPMIMFFPLVDLAWLGQIKTLEFFNSSTCVCIGKGFWSICIVGGINHPSSMADCIFLRSTLQSLVAWEKVLWNLQ